MDQIEFIIGLRCPFDGLVEVTITASNEQEAMVKARRLRPGSSIRFVREASQ